VLGRAHLLGKTGLQGSAVTFVEGRRQTGMKYCLHCGFVGVQEQFKPGSTRMEVGLWLLAFVPGVISSIWTLFARHVPGPFPMEFRLWLLFLIPGVMYSVWRLFARYQGCAHCAKKHIVPMDSPAALTALDKRSPTLSLKPWVCMACGEPIFQGGIFCKSCAAEATRAIEGIALVRF
jgi:uncharacterized membrane protein YqaE (UPF0057 family)